MCMVEGAVSCPDVLHGFVTDYPVYKLVLLQCLFLGKYVYLIYLHSEKKNVQQMLTSFLVQVILL